PVTPGLLVHVPDVEVLAANVAERKISVRFKHASSLGPFGDVALAESVAAHAKEADKVRRLWAYNYLTRELPANALDEFIRIYRPQDAAAFIQKYGPLAGNKIATQTADGTYELEIPFEDFVLQQRDQFLLILALTQAVTEGKKSDIKESLKDAARMGL